MKRYFSVVMFTVAALALLGMGLAPSARAQVVTISWSDIDSSSIPAAIASFGSLSDPNADRIAFWDESAGSGGALAWLTVANSLSISTTTLQLTNDSASPGNSKYYGTDGSGTRGYFALPSTATWGALTGTLSDQTDLQSALDAKITAAVTTTAGIGFVVDEDTMSSDSATKVPTQQSVKAYVDAAIFGAGSVSSVNGASGAVVLDADDLDDTSTTNKFTTAADISKLAGIEAAADVTDATNVDAAGAVMNSDTSTAAMSFVVDEDDMVSDSATKVPTQQSVKAWGTSTFPQLGTVYLKPSWLGSVDMSIVDSTSFPLVNLLLALDSYNDLASAAGFQAAIGGINLEVSGAWTYDLIPRVPWEVLTTETALTVTHAYRRPFTGTNPTLTFSGSPSSADGVWMLAAVTTEDDVGIPSCFRLSTQTTETSITLPVGTWLLAWKYDSTGARWLLSDTVPVAVAASAVSVAATPANYTPDDATVEGHLAGIDDVLAGIGASTVEDDAFTSGWNTDTTHSPSQNALYDYLHLGDTDDDGKIDVLDIVSTAGLMAVTSGGVPVQGRTITGTSNEISVANGDGASANPTISIPATFDLSGKTAVSVPTVSGGTDSDTSAASTAFVQAAKNLGQTISITADGLSDDTYTGAVLMTGKNAGATISQWDVVYLNSSGAWVLADANGSGTYPARGLAITSGTSGNPLTVLIRGFVRNDGWAWGTVGANLYISTTAGTMTQTAPSTTGDKVQVLGYAITDDEIYFNPSMDYGTAP